MTHNKLINNDLTPNFFAASDKLTGAKLKQLQAKRAKAGATKEQLTIKF